MVAAVLLLGIGTGGAVEPAAPTPRNEGFGLGLRVNAQLSGQDPVRDLSGYGVFGRLRLAQNREFGIGVDVLSDEIKHPARKLGLANSGGLGEAEAKITANIFSVWGLQNFDPGWDPLHPFLLAGLGLASMDIESSNAYRIPGRSFDLRTNAGTEHIFMAGAGTRVHLTASLTLEIAIRGEYHLANWTVEDRVSGAYLGTEDYFALGAYAALGLDF